MQRGPLHVCIPIVIDMFVSLSTAIVTAISTDNIRLRTDRRRRLLTDQNLDFQARLGYVACSARECEECINGKSISISLYSPSNFSRTREDRASSAKYVGWREMGICFDLGNSRSSILKFPRRHKSDTRA